MGREIGPCTRTHRVRSSLPFRNSRPTVSSREQGREGTRSACKRAIEVSVPLGKQITGFIASRHSLHTPGAGLRAGLARARGSGFSARRDHPQAGQLRRPFRGKRGRCAGSRGGHAAPSGPFPVAHTFHKEEMSYVSLGLHTVTP